MIVNAIISTFLLTGIAFKRYISFLENKVYFSLLEINIDKFKE